MIGRDDHLGQSQTYNLGQSPWEYRPGDIFILIWIKVYSALYGTVYYIF